MVYLQDIKFTNFKCFEDTSILKLGKLTLLTGANSTGKSSLMYGVLGMLQSKKFPLALSPNGGYVQMGNFLEMVFKHDPNKKIGIGFTLVDSDLNESLAVDTVWRNNKVGNPYLENCELTSNYYHLSIKSQETGHILNLDIEPEKSAKKIDMEDLLRYASTKTPTDATLVEYLKYATKETHIKDYTLDSFSDETKAEIKFPLSYIMQETQSFIRKYNEGVNYISSYRQPAQRIYTEEPMPQGKIATSGEGFINELLKWKDDRQDKFSEFVKGMKSIGLLSEIEPSRLGAGQFKISVKVHDGDDMANLGDVGFGISQMMPVIIGDVELGKGSTLYVSQPEVHLHPSAQAKFGDYIVRQMNEGKRYVIESHSEYLMNRLRLSIVKGVIHEEDVKVYYMSQANGNTKIFDIKFKASGQIEGAPQDFFDTYMIDVMDIAMSAQ